jgi:thiosulfate dehydrogenase
MKAISLSMISMAAALALVAAPAHSEPPSDTGRPIKQEPAPPKPTATSATTRFTPPAADSIPDNDFGKMVKKGEQIFINTRQNAPQFVGNSLNCVNCHLDAGRKANASPLWAAYISYPAYRGKNKHVNTFAERLQGCFRFSMNGKAPPLGDPTLVALESYAYWMATGAPVGGKVAGRGYPDVPKPPQPGDYVRGEKVYAQSCALCHGAEGQGQTSGGATVFPPLWGPKSFNWGAGMHDIKNAAGFIKANMPLGSGGTLTDQEAWDVATFMDSHERPQDPRFAKSVEETRSKYHGEPTSMYGKTVNGRVLGENKQKTKD